MSAILSRPECVNGDVTTNIYDDSSAMYADILLYHSPMRARYGVPIMSLIPGLCSASVIEAMSCYSELHLSASDCIDIILIYWPSRCFAVKH